MKRIVLLALVLSLVTPAVGAADVVPDGYGFTISASDTDPFDNSTFVSGGVGIHFLWYVCAKLPSGYDQGIAAAEIGLLSSDPTNIIIVFQPAGIILNAGTSLDLLLAIPGCPAGPMLMGTIITIDLVPGNYCLGPTSQYGQQLAGVDCSINPTIWPIEWIGLELGGAGGCDSGNPLCYGPISVETESWSGVKSLYR